ncbi:MAG: MazG-like family protein [Bacillota bacterium]
MHVNQREIDITKGIKAIEWLKAELVGTLGSLFKALVRGSEDLVVDSLAGLIMNVFLLGKRMGISFARIDLQVENKVQQCLEEDHQVEKWYGDLSALLNYLEIRRGEQ